jgi:hypothetical protein
MNTKRARKNRKKHPRNPSRGRRRKSAPAVGIPFAERSRANRPLHPGSTGESLERTAQPEGLPSKARTTTPSGDLTGILGDKFSAGEPSPNLSKKGRTSKVNWWTLLEPPERPTMDNYQSGASRRSEFPITKTATGCRVKPRSVSCGRLRLEGTGVPYHLS